MKNVIITVAVLLYAASAISMQNELVRCAADMEAQALYPAGICVKIETV